MAELSSVDRPGSPDGTIDAGNRPAPGIIKALHSLLVIACGGVAAVVVHLFFEHVGNAPYLSTDDALVDIAYSLSHFGRFGIPSGPVQAGNLSLRLDGFHNYGPWYFYAGAALSWLFGLSHELQRAIHLFGILFIGGAALVSFRYLSLAAGGAVFAALACIFVYNHWPMVRPDIMVSVLATLGIASAGAAVRTDSPKWWFAAAFFFAATISQHLIAWAVAPGMILVWAAAQFLRPYMDAPIPDGTRPQAGNGRAISTFAAAVLAVVVAAVIHLVAIDFRIADVIQHVTDYGERVANASHVGGTIAVMTKHFDSAWAGNSPLLKTLVFAGFGAAILLLAGLRWLPHADRRIVLAALLPPVAVSVGYQASLGFYGNWHAGYTILSHVATVWASGAALAVLLYLARRRMDRFGWLPEGACAVALIVVLVVFGTRFIEHPSHMRLAASKWVNIEDYVDAVLAPLPPRARAWGSFFFGLESGVRTDLLQLSDGMHLIQKIKPERRREFAPEYLVIGYREQNDVTALLVKDPQAPNLFERMPKIVAGVRYEPVSIVAAPPYGASRVYHRVQAAGGGAGTTAPAVRFNDGTSRQWLSRLMAPVPTAFMDTAPVSFDLPYAGGLFKESTAGRAMRSRVGTLERGVYLLSMDLTRAGDDGSGSVIATRSPRFTADTSELGYGFAAVPYFGYERRVHLLLAHGGGPLYLSQIDSDAGADFTIATVQPLEPYEPLTVATALPPFDQWRVFGDDAKVRRRDADSLAMTGDASRWHYQVASPPIAVDRHSLITIRLPIEVEAGALGTGVLDANGQWLLSPRSGTPEITFNTLATDRITVVIANDNYDGAEGPVRFSLTRGSLTVVRSSGPRTYADDLSLCHRSKRQLNPDACQ